MPKTLKILDTKTLSVNLLKYGTTWFVNIGSISLGGHGRSIILLLFSPSKIAHGAVPLGFGSIMASFGK